MKKYLALAAKLLAERFTKTDLWTCERLDCDFEPTSGGERLRLAVHVYADAVEASLVYRDSQGESHTCTCVTREMAFNPQRQALAGVLMNADKAGVLARFVELREVA